MSGGSAPPAGWSSFQFENEAMVELFKSREKIVISMNLGDKNVSSIYILYICAILTIRPSRPGPKAPHIKGPPTFQSLSVL